MVGPPGRQTSQSGRALPGGAASRSLRLYRTHMFRPDLPCTRNCGESSQGLRLAECGGKRLPRFRQRVARQVGRPSAANANLDGKPGDKNFTWVAEKFFVAAGATWGYGVDIRYAPRPR